MQSAPSVAFNNNAVLQPLYPHGVEQLPINLSANLTVLAGTVLGQITNSANDVQTFTVTGTPTGGSVTVSGVNPDNGAAVSFPVSWNSNAAAAQTAAQLAFGAGNVTVTGGALPGTALIFTFAGSLAAQSVPVMTISTNALTGGASPNGTFAHTTTGRLLGTYAAYASGNSDGSQVAKCILAYTVTTDALGFASLGLVAGGQFGEARPDTPAYFGGYFDTSKLIGLDATAVTALGALISGTTSAGVLKVK